MFAVGACVWQIRVVSFLDTACVARVQWEDADDVEDEWETAKPDQAMSAAGAVGSFDVNEEEAEAGQNDPWLNVTLAGLR